MHRLSAAMIRRCGSKSASDPTQQSQSWRSCHRTWPPPSSATTAVPCFLSPFTRAPLISYRQLKSGEISRSVGGKALRYLGIFFSCHTSSREKGIKRSNKLPYSILSGRITALLSKKVSIVSIKPLHFHSLRSYILVAIVETRWLLNLVKVMD